jgi:hypothetical protein
MRTPASAGMKTDAPFQLAGRHWLAPYSASQSASASYFGASAMLASCALPNSARHSCSVTACELRHSSSEAKASVVKPEERSALRTGSADGADGDIFRAFQGRLPPPDNRSSTPR